jgi:hypothetical protein
VVPEEASTFGTGSSVLWCLRMIYLWNRKLSVVVPEEDLQYLWNRNLCVLVPEEDHLWNRKLCVVMPERDILLEQEALCCGP